MKKIQFVRDVFVDGAKVHGVGDQANASPELEKHVRRGNAVEIEVADEDGDEGNKGKKGKKGGGE
jgi:hypothetical protein